MKRQRYLRLRERLRRRGKRFIYMDESGFALSAERTHGYARKGQRVYGLKSGHSRPRTHLIAAWREGDKRLSEPFLFQRTCTREVVNQWLEHHICSTLTPNDVIVMDNAAFHTSARTRQLIETTGATLLFLPPYSPDLNPIEQRFATLKKYRTYHPNLSLTQLLQASG